MRNDLPQFRVQWFKKGSSGVWDTNSTDISDAVDVSSNSGLETKNDTFTLRLKCKDDRTSTLRAKYRMNADGSDYFGIDDRIRIYAWYGTEPSVFDSKFIFDGVVREWTYESSSSGRTLVLTGANVAEELLRVILPAAYLMTDSQHTAPDILQAQLDRMNALNSATASANYRKVYWDASNPTSGFKTISYGSTYRPVYQQIADLSTEAQTGVGDFYYYIRTDVDGKNYLVWQKKTSVVGTYDLIIEGYDFTRLKLEKGVFDAYNAAIIHCGKDPEGVGIYTWAIDAESAGKIGTRWKYLQYQKGEDIMAKERQFNSANFTTDSAYPTAYNYTTHFVALQSDTDAPVFTAGSTVTCTNNVQFRSAIRKEAKYEAKRDGLELIRKNGKAQYRAGVDLAKGTLKYTQGQLVKLIVPSMGYTLSPDKSILLRVTGVSHSIGKDGWQTSLELEQDIKDASVV